MMSLHTLPDEDSGAAVLLTAALKCEIDFVEMHHFPDGESLPKVSNVAARALIYRPLHNPNAKLIECLLICDALRRAGAEHVTLVAPYLPYLRQDAVFQPGQSLSRDVIVPLLARSFDAILTVDPHLHRTARLTDVGPATRWIVCGGALAIAEGMRTKNDASFDIIVGPDSESQQWVRTVSDALGVPYWTFRKERRGDRQVCLAPPPGVKAHGARVLIVDDVCASGGTLSAVANHLQAMGAAHIEAAVTHALFGKADALVLQASGIARIRSCDGCAHATNSFSLAPTIAAALRREDTP